MGATVQFFDRYQRLVRESMTSVTDVLGLPDSCQKSIRSELQFRAFFPAARDKIAIRAGLSSVLQVRLTSVLSTVEVQYTAPTGVMSDDWKWVLRSSNATRAITRDLPVPTGLGSSSSSEDPKEFSLAQEAWCRFLLEMPDLCYPM